MIIAIILSAGKSTRMGTAKALLRFDADTLLSLMAETALSGGADHVCIVLGSEAEKIRNHCRLAESEKISFVQNGNFEKGQTSSIQKGIEHLPKECRGFFLQPVDMPGIQAVDYRKLIGVFNKDKNAESKIFCASFQGKRGHPALYGKNLREEFLSLPEDQPANAIIRKDDRRVICLETNNPDVLQGMNTMDEYRICKESRDESKRRELSSQAWIQMVNPKDADEKLSAIYKSRPDSGLDPSRSVQSLMPDALAAFDGAYQRLLEAPGPLEFLHRRILACVVLSCNECQWGLARQKKELLGLAGPNALHLLREDEENQNAISALIRYAKKLSLTPSKMLEDDVLALKNAKFSHEQILHAASLTSFMNYYARLVNGLGVGRGV